MRRKAGAVTNKDFKRKHNLRQVRGCAVESWKAPSGLSVEPCPVGYVVNFPRRNKMKIVATLAAADKYIAKIVPKAGL